MITAIEPLKVYLTVRLMLWFFRLSDLENIRPHLPTKSGNLATYVNDSETLTKLVQLGVNLSVVEKNQAVANHLLKVDFDTNIRIYLEFLHKITVATNDFGQIITRSPSLLLEDLDDLQVPATWFYSSRLPVLLGELLSKTAQ